GTGGERVDVDHLALRGEFVHPERELVGRAEIARGGTRDLREQDVDVRIGVDAGRPLRTVEPAVRRVDLVLERRRTRSALIDVDSSEARMSDGSGATLAPGAVLAALVALALGEGERSVLVCGGRHAPPTRTRVRRIARRRGTFTADGNRRRACASRRRGR